jgi:flagellar basal-body rod protein FlgB
MDILKSSLMTGLAQRLQFLAARAGVIAENIANADTPDYAAKDLKTSGFASHLAAMKTSDPRHMSAPPGGAVRYRVQSAPDPDAALNGNKVSVETQMMKLSETRMDYQLASSIYKKGVELIRLAARGGR